MGGKKTARIVIDVVLTLMIVFEMFIQYTGDFLHEVMGFAFFATVMTHLILSAKWMKGTAKAVKKGTMTAKRTAFAIIDALLAVDMVVLGVSSVAISGILSDAGFVWALGSYALWTTVHAVSSYAICALVALHLGMHWVFLASAFRVPYDPSRRRAISAGVNVVAAVGAVALGVMAIDKALPRTAVASTVDEPEDDAFADPVDDRRGKSHGSSGSAKARPDFSDGSPSEHDGAPTYEEGSSDYEEIPSDSNGSSDVSGFCTLCRKQCPLSAPQCDRPYEEGLL